MAKGQRVGRGKRTAPPRKRVAGTAPKPAPTRRKATKGANTRKFVASRTKVARAQQARRIGASGLPSEARSIMTQLLMPVSASGLRLSSTASQSRTGTATVHHDFSITQGAGYVGTYGAVGEQLFYLFRQPLRQAVVLVRTTANQGTLISPGVWAFVYHSIFDNGTQSRLMPAAEKTALPISYLQCTSAEAPHGPYEHGVSNLYTGTIASKGDLMWVWMDPGDHFHVQADAGTSTLNVYELADYPSSKPTVAFLSTITAVASLCTFQATIPGYYAFEHVPDGTARSLSAYLHVYPGDHMAHYSVPQPLSHANWFTNVRANAVSLLISNRTAKQWVNGTCVGSHITEPIPFYKVAKTTIGDRNVYYQGLAEKGMYSYLPLWGERALEFFPAIELSDGAQTIAAGSVTNTQFPLDDNTGYCAFSVTSVLNNSAYALDFHCVLTTALEFKTEDQYAELEFPSISSNATNDIINWMSRDFPITENPLHWDDVTSFVSRVGRFAASHAKKIGGALSTLFPAYALPINFVANRLQS